MARLRSHSKAEECRRDVALRIVAGALPTGARITEHALAEQLGVGRAPLREALMGLVEYGLVERTAYRGMRVCPITARRIAEAYEIRITLEMLACRRAAARMNEERAAELMRFLDAHEAEAGAALSEGGEPALLATSFHAAVIRLANSTELARCVRQEAWFHAVLNARLFRERRAPYLLIASEHRAVAEALCAGDGELAATRMREHLADGRDRLLALQWSSEPASLTHDGANA